MYSDEEHQTESALANQTLGAYEHQMSEHKLAASQCASKFSLMEDALAAEQAKYSAEAKRCTELAKDLEVRELALHDILL
jgi:hypothetical protein